MHIYTYIRKYEHICIFKKKKKKRIYNYLRRKNICFDHPSPIFCCYLSTVAWWHRQDASHCES